MLPIQGFFTRMILVCVAVLSDTSVVGQLQKGTWLIGGSASFNQTVSNGEEILFLKRRSIHISPDIGYFLSDRFASGIKLTYTNSSNTVSSASNTRQQVNIDKGFGIGPFVRFYLLQSETPLNFLIEGSYQYRLTQGGGGPSRDEIQYSRYSQNIFNGNAGPVIYFTSSAALELLIGYSYGRTVNSGNSEGTMQFSLGFHFHLEPLLNAE